MNRLICNCPLVALLVAMAAVQRADADIVLSFNPQSTTVTIPTAGTTQFEIDVQMASDVGTLPIFGYTIPVDLQPPAGTDPPTGWTVVDVASIFDFPDNPFIGRPSPDPAEGDVLAADANSASGTINFDATPVSLFSFTVEIDNTAIAGNYLATFVDGVLLSIDDEAMNPIPRNELTLGVGNITLQNVPEPGAGMLAAVSCMLVCIGRRRRKSC